MHPVILLRFGFYAVAIILHSVLAIAVGVVSHEGLLGTYDGNHVPLIIGAVWTVVLTILIVCDVTRSRKSGFKTRQRRWIVRTWNELNVFFHLMFWELLFCGLNTRTTFNNVNCEDDALGRCTRRSLIFGLWWSAATTVTIYFWGLMAFGFFVVADLDSETNVRDYYDFSEARGEMLFHSKTEMRLSDLEEVPRRFSTFAKDGLHPVIQVPQAR